MPPSNRHRYEKIEDDLKKSIRNGVVSPGSLLPSERELQEIYGVSRVTIRRALAALMASGWAENNPYRGAIARLGKNPSKSFRVAYVDHRDHVHKTLFFDLHRGLCNAGYDLVHFDSQELGTMAALRRAADEGCAGAFVWPKVAHVPTGELSELQSRLPIIAVDHSIGGEPCDLVMSDHMDGARKLVHHLVASGRKKIAITGFFTNMEDAQLRFNGYLVGLYECNVAPEAHNFVFSSPQPEPFEDLRLLTHRLRQSDRPDAVFVLHDMSVPATVDAINGMGLSVPKDVAVVGFGNDLPFSTGEVGLTTIAMNWDSVADRLLNRLQERIAQPHAQFVRCLVPVSLMVRGSCGAPQDKWTSEPYEVSSVTTTNRMRPLSQFALTYSSFAAGDAMEAQG